MVFTEESTTGAFLLRARREGIRDFGACMAPFVAFQILQGIETLPLRMQRHVDNTRRIVAFLREQPLVGAIGYPELPGHPDHALAQRLLPKGCGAVFSFDLKGTRAQGRKFIETLRIFSHLANVGDAKSLVIHPASTTHFRMTAEDLAKAGITEGTIRLSVGLENADDLIEDLSRAVRGGQGLRRARDAATLEERGCEEVRLLMIIAGNDVYAYTGARPSTQRCRPSSSSTARRTTTASGRCSRATSRITGATCWRSTCPVTAVRAARRSRASRRSPTG